MNKQLLLELSALPQGRKNLHFMISSQELEIENLEIVGQIDARLDLFRNGDTVTVNGKLNFTIKLPCANCLKIFEQNFSEIVCQEFIKGKEPIFYYPQRLEEEDIDREYYTTDFIDLTSVIRDTIKLAVPLAPWCSKDCQGVKE